MKYCVFLVLFNTCIAFAAISEVLPSQGIIAGVPPRRAEYCKWSGNNKLYVYGGVPRDTREVPGLKARELGDLWEFNLTTRSWRMLYESSIPITTAGVRKDPSAAGPANREGAACWTYNGELYLFGGRRGTADISHYDHLNDMWAFNPLKGTWRLISAPVQKQAVESVPFARRNAITWLRNDSLLLTSGRGVSGDVVLKDFWIFDLKKESWTNIVPRVDTAIANQNESNRKEVEAKQKELYQQVMAGTIPPAVIQKKNDSLAALLRKTMLQTNQLPTETTSFDATNFPLPGDEQSSGFVLGNRLLLTGTSPMKKSILFWEFNLQQKSWRVVPGSLRPFEYRRNATECDQTATPGYGFYDLISPLQNNKVFIINHGTTSGFGWTYDFTKNCWTYFDKMWGKIGEDSGPLEGQWNMWWQIDPSNIGFTNVQMADFWILNTETMKWTQK